MKTEPTPYTLIIRNVNAAYIQEAVLFGFKAYEKTKNFGSEPSIKICTPMKTISYKQVLNQSVKQPFKASKIEVYATNPQIAIPLLISSSDSSGNSCMSVFSGEIKGHMAVMTGEFDINQEVDIKLSVLPLETVVIKIYPS